MSDRALPGNEGGTASSSSLEDDHGAFFYLRKGGDKVLKQRIHKSLLVSFSQIKNGGDPDG